MKAIKTAVYDLFKKTTGGAHNSFWLGIGGRLYDTQADQGAALPCAVYSVTSSVPEFTFTSTFENVILQFSLFSNSSSASEVEDMFDNLRTLFDWCSLTITGYTFLYMRREGATLSRDAEGVWQYDIDYRIFAEKS